MKSMPLTHISLDNIEMQLAKLGNKGHLYSHGTGASYKPIEVVFFMF